MEVILLQDIDNLGKQGDLVKVKDGYGRNYLLPNRKAVLATPEAMKMVKKMQEKRAAEEVKLMKKAQGIKEKLESLSITIPSEAGEEDKLYGTITTEMIKDAIAIEGVEIDKRKINIQEPIKKLGVYDISIKVYADVIAQIRIWVVKK